MRIEDHIFQQTDRRNDSQVNVNVIYSVNRIITIFIAILDSTLPVATRTQNRGFP